MFKKKFTINWGYSKINYLERYISDKAIKYTVVYVLFGILYRH